MLLPLPQEHGPFFSVHPRPPGLPVPVFNASVCGDDCAKWILSIGKSKDLTINLRHIMDFGEEDFEIEILNTGDIVHNMLEYVDIAGEYV